MKTLLILVLGLLLLVATVTIIHSSTIRHEPDPVVVLELFTSQGCSSCPPADALLNDITQHAASQNKSVYGLSFHVNYWDHLGWKDPYSSEEFTQRQRQYGQHFGLKSVYTPQLVVNGTQEVVGSSKQKLTEAMRSAPEVNCKISGSVKEDIRELRIEYQTDSTFPDAVMNIALVESGLQSKIKGGENRGKTLFYDNVVRAFATQPLTKNGKATLQFPESLNRDKSSVILYAQDKKSQKVLGAVRLPILR